MKRCEHPTASGADDVKMNACAYCELEKSRREAAWLRARLVSAESILKQNHLAIVGMEKI